jgi:leader peptidase (prepilin peptidase)/N-methyltransferase
LAISVAGLLVGGGVVWIVRIIGHWVLRREAMGFGDVVLMAMIGSFLGWQAAVTIFFIAPACALLVVALCWIVRRDREIPYGPYISLATLLMLFAWPKLWTAAERIFCLGPVVILMGLAMSVMLVATLYAMQGVKRLLGIPLHEESWLAEWTSADQLAHFAGEHVDEQQGGWRHEVWQGQLSGRGLSHYETWRRGSRDRR